jgi:hypothetical protein
MPPRPNRYPSFAIDAAPADIVEIPAGVAATGFAPGQRPPAQWLNYFFNLLGAWVNLLRGASPTNWTRRAPAGPTGWDTVVGTSDNVRVHVAIDAATPEREVAPFRYVQVGPDAAGPGALQVWVSRRGVAWTDQSAQLPVGFVDDPPRGLGQFGGRWVFWTHGQLFSTPRDTAAGLSALDPTGPDWVLAALPAAVNTLLSLAYDPATATFAIGYDTTTARGWAYSLDGAQTFTAAGITSGPGTGSPRAVAWSGNYFVSVTTTGQTWRSPGSGSNFAQTASLPASDFWHLAAGAGLVVAYEVLQTTTRIYVSDDDGATWSAVTVPSGVRKLSRLLFADGAWVATALDAPYVWTSNDLVTWVRGVLPHPETADPLYDLAYGEGTLFAVGDSVSYQSHRAADAGPGPADGLTTPLVLADAAYLQGRVVSSAAPGDGARLEWSAVGAAWGPDGSVRGTVQTTDATQTTAASFTVADKSVVTLIVTISAMQSDYSKGAGYQRRATYRRDGALSLIGTVQTLGTDAEESAGWDVTLDLSGSAVRARVTGAAATTVNWTAAMRPEATAT